MRVPIRLVDRRRLLAGSASVLVAASTGLRDARGTSAWSDLPTSQSLTTYAPVALAPAELDILKAATDRIIPPDAAGPGATGAGVFVYIDRGLGTHLQYALPTYREGLAALDAAAQPFGFANLSPEEQDAVMSAAEAGSLPNMPDNFFSLLLLHTREGMFSDPVHGGNVEFAGWDLIGYAGVKLVWTEHEQALDVSPVVAHTSVEDLGADSNG